MPAYELVHLSQTNARLLNGQKVKLTASFFLFFFFFPFSSSITGAIGVFPTSIT
jgi:hypothetical protein